MNTSRRMFSQGSKVIAIGVLGLMLNACNSDHDHHKHHKSNIAGYVYTSTNGNGSEGLAGENHVLRLTRYKDGTLGKEKVYDTDGTGASDVNAGGAARGDFDSQDAMKIIGDYLLVVNAGSNNVSVFKIDKTNGDLTLASTVETGGSRPVSLAVTKNGSSDGSIYWVVVGNQWNNPNVQGTVDSPICYPTPTAETTSYFASNCKLNEPTAMDDGRNITLFQFDSSNGALTLANVGNPLATYDRQTGGPADVTFSDDGTKLAVSTWGIAHIADDPSASLQEPGAVYVYDFNNTSGAVSNERHFEQEGIAATVGINWAKGSNSIIHASNANITSQLKQDGFGLTVLKDENNQVTLDQNFNTGDPATADAACWTLLSPSGDRVYVASFRTNQVTPFQLKSSDGTVDKALAYAGRPVTTDPDDVNKNPDFKDMYISSDNQYLYVLGAFNSYSVNRFQVTADGLKYVDQYIFPETKDDQGDTGQYNFLGFVGFDMAND